MNLKFPSGSLRTIYLYAFGCFLCSSTPVLNDWHDSAELLRPAEEQENIEHMQDCSPEGLGLNSPSLAQQHFHLRMSKTFAEYCEYRKPFQFTRVCSQKKNLNKIQRIFVVKCVGFCKQLLVSFYKVKGLLFKGTLYSKPNQPSRRFLKLVAE